MDTLRKIIRAKVDLLLKSPFLGTICCALIFREDNSIPTAATDGKEIIYNRQFIDSLTKEELPTLIAHECYHVAFLHHIRIGDRDHMQWNIACDFAINYLLKKAGFTAIRGWLCDDKYEDWSSEKIYPTLTKPGKNEEAAAGIGWVKKPEAGKGEEGLTDSQLIAKRETEAKQLVSRALQAAKMQGSLPAGMELAIEDVLTVPVDWKEATADFITSISTTDYSFSTPNKRYLHTGFALPSLRNECRQKIAVCIDTSGSIGGADLNLFGAHVKELCDMLNSGVTVIWTDAAIAGVQEFEAGEPLKLIPKGGGGTDYRPAFKFIEESEAEYGGIIYITDGYCDSFPKAEPALPVLWVLPEKNNKFKPAFGNIIIFQHD